MRKLFVKLTASNGEEKEFHNVDCVLFNEFGFFRIFKEDGEQEVYHPDKVASLMVVPQ